MFQSISNQRILRFSSLKGRVMIFRLTRRWQTMVVTCLRLTLQWGEKTTIIARESCSTILDCRMLIKKELKLFQTSSINAHGKLEPWRRLSRNWDILRWKTVTEYRISSNNSRPLINRLRQIIAPPRPSRNLLFLLSPPCQVEVKWDPAKLIGDDSNSEN